MRYLIALLLLSCGPDAAPELCRPACERLERCCDADPVCAGFVVAEDCIAGCEGADAELIEVYDYERADLQCVIDAPTCAEADRCGE